MTLKDIPVRRPVLIVTKDGRRILDMQGTIPKPLVLRKVKP